MSAVRSPVEPARARPQRDQLGQGETGQAHEPRTEEFSTSHSDGSGCPRLDRLASLWPPTDEEANPMLNNSLPPDQTSSQRGLGCALGVSHFSHGYGRRP
jgi:hypothetical protein